MPITHTDTNRTQHKRWMIGNLCKKPCDGSSVIAISIEVIFCGQNDSICIYLFINDWYTFTNEFEYLLSLSKIEAFFNEHFTFLHFAVTFSDKTNEWKYEIHIFKIE